MPNINWGQVGNDVKTAVSGVLGSSWNIVSSAAGPQIQAMINIAQMIEQSYSQGNLTKDEYDTLRSNQKNALEGVLSSYAAVGIVVAEQAADAAWAVVSRALQSGAGVAFI